MKLICFLLDLFIALLIPTLLWSAGGWFVKWLFEEPFDLWVFPKMVIDILDFSKEERRMDYFIKCLSILAMLTLYIPSFAVVFYKDEKQKQ